MNEAATAPDNNNDADDSQQEPRRLLQEETSSLVDERGGAAGEGGEGGGGVAVTAAINDAVPPEEEPSAAKNSSGAAAVESSRAAPSSEDEKEAVPADGPPQSEEGAVAEAPVVTFPAALVLDDDQDRTSSFLAPGYTTSSDPPPANGTVAVGRYSHAAQPSSDSLPVLLEEEVVEVQLVGTAVGLTPLELLDLSSSDNSVPSHKNQPPVPGGAPSSKGRHHPHSGNSNRGGLSRPPMVSRVHSVDTNYGLDDDALAAISGGGLGDGGSELGDNDGESRDGGANSHRPSPVTTPTTSTAAASGSAPVVPPGPPPSSNGSPRCKAPTTTTTTLKKPPPRIPAAEALPPRLRSTSSASRKTSVSNSSGEGDNPLPADNNEYEEYDNEEELPDDRIRLGICAMDKKARSKPMAEILSRLDENLFHVVFFGDEVILNAPIEDWPICHVLIAFFSKGYPLPKAKEYVQLRKPFILNDLGMQALLQDRRRVYDLLEASGIDVPRHAYMSRDGYVSTGTGAGNGSGDTEVAEFDDHIEINGISIHKPFVEKPVDAEDHNIAIYYPTSAGGGCKKLFRKIGNRSSEFYPEINEVRRDGSYIYEEFVETQGTDVKMYTVGPEYGHAEARKSPTVDGIVERNETGKEVRFPVILTFREKEIARRIVLVFKQFVCGFDILRVQERHSVVSYVCDVNGWSFVKNSRKYYDDCSQILSEHIIALVKPAALTTFSTLDPLMTTNPNRLDEDFPEEGKRKETFLSKAARMLQGEPDMTDDDLEANTSMTPTPTRELVSASPPRHHETADLLSSAAATLSEGALPVRDFPSELTSQPASLAQSEVGCISYGDVREALHHRSTKGCHGSHQEELRCVIAIVRHGDRTPKQKLKVNMTCPQILKFFHKHVKDCQKDLKVKAKAGLTEFLLTIKSTLGELKGSENESVRLHLLHMRDILERWKIVGLNRKLQIKPRKFEEYEDEKGVIRQRCTEVQLILKWGGNLTRLGEKQSIKLGKRFRHEMYPDAPGGGILRLHSTFRHDLKIKTSDEGRVMKTAAAFAKGLLELEGELPPILVSLVHKEKGSMHLLDPSGNKEVKMELDECKEKITANLQRDIDVNAASAAELDQLVGPVELTSLRDALGRVENPRKTLVAIHQTMGELITELEEMLGVLGSGDEKRIEGGEGLRGENEDDVALSGVKLYKGETLLELTERWRFIYDRLYDPDTETFDLSRIPDVHDNVRFDVLHNPHLGLSKTLHKLYELAKIMADCVVPQEYGTTVEEKRSVGLKICHSLLEKIKYDIGVARTDNDTDMRYLINMEYSFDLNINTMGRRIRTRLYFTSESHLHTVLNTLRFACHDGCKSLLSESGLAILNATPELCYLTQIVMRVFEDSRRDMSDPRRFRVELLFSPGATATPFHMGENDRDSDISRFDTAPLQKIGRDDLTCKEVEDFLESAIMAGRGEDDEYEIASMSTAPAEPLSKLPHPKNGDRRNNTPTQSNKTVVAPHDIPSKVVLHGMSDLVESAGTVESDIPNLSREESLAMDSSPTVVDSNSMAPEVASVEAAIAPPANGTASVGPLRLSSRGLEDIATVVVVPKDGTVPPSAPFEASSLGGDSIRSSELADDTKPPPGNAPPSSWQLATLEPKSEMEYRSDAESPPPTGPPGRVSIVRRYFWRGVAAGSFVLGTGCLLMALGFFDRRRPHRRRYSIAPKWH